MQVLENVRVLTLATNLPGPLAVERLRSMGAQVRKIEPPTGDLLQRAQAEWYRRLHEGVQVERVDLKAGAGRERLGQYLLETDLLITASRPASLARLGLAWEELHGRFPRVSHLAIVGNPAPEEDLPGHDLLYQAEQGLVRPPDMPTTCIADLGGAQEVVIAALQLVLAHRSGAPGVKRTVSLAESASWFAEPVRRGLTKRGGMLGGGFGGYQVYRTKQGWIAVAALEPQFQAALARETGVSDLDTDRLREKFLTRPASEWVALAREKDLPLVEVVEN